MAKDEVALTKTDSILDELDRLHDEVSRRAYALFEDHNGLYADPLGDWLCAEREVVWSPAIELRQQDGRFELEAAMAGVDPKDLDVQVTPHDILIQAKGEHRHATGKATVHACEFQGGRLFRSIHLPDTIDQNSVKAEYRNGLLHLFANVAKAEPKRVEVQAA